MELENNTKLLIGPVFNDGFTYLLGESKVWQYFGNVRHNSVAPDAFANIGKRMNQTGL